MHLATATVVRERSADGFWAIHQEELGQVYRVDLDSFRTERCYSQELRRYRDDYIIDSEDGEPWPVVLLRIES